MKGKVCVLGLIERGWTAVNSGACAVIRSFVARPALAKSEM